MAIQEKVFTTGDLAWQSWSRSYVLKLYVKEEFVSVSDNSSQVSYVLQLVSGGNNRFSDWPVHYSVTINGSAVDSGSPQFSQPFNHTTTLASGTVTVPHESDGSKNLSVKGHIHVNSDRSFLPPPMDIDELFRLTSVARASAPSLSRGSVTLGDDITIYTNSASSEFKHHLKYQINDGNEEYFAYDVKESYNWSVPVSLASEIPNKTEGKITIICHTYKDNTFVGGSEITVPLYVPNIDALKPSIENISYSPISDLPESLQGMFIMQKTRVDASATVTGKYSDIKSVIWTIEGKKYSGSKITSEILSGYGHESISVTATDSRGFSRTETGKLPVVAYWMPCLEPAAGQEKIICERADASGVQDDSGTYLSIKCARYYAQVNYNGKQNNVCDVFYRVKAANQNNYGSENILLSGSDFSTNQINVVLPDVVANLFMSYSVQIILRDTAKSENVYTFSINTEDVDFHLREKGHGAAFGKYSTEPYTLESAWDVHAYKDVKIDGTLFGQYLEPRTESDVTDPDSIRKAGVYRLGGCSILGSPWYGMLIVFSTSHETGNAGILQLAASQPYGYAIRFKWYDVNEWTAWKPL